MRAGIAAAIAFVVLGIGIISFEYYLLTSSGKFYPKLLAASFILIVLGLTMFIFPGPKMSFSQIRKEPRKGRGGPLWVNAPTGHKVAWIIGVVIGAALAIYVMVDLTDGGPINDYINSLRD